MFQSSHLTKLYNPAGLDLGAETPAEIALAIIAEIQAVLANQPAGFLRERKSAIHSEPKVTTDSNVAAAR